VEFEMKQIFDLIIANILVPCGYFCILAIFFSFFPNNRSVLDEGQENHIIVPT